MRRASRGSAACPARAARSRRGAAAPPPPAQPRPHAFGDDGGTNDRRDDQHVIAGPEPPSGRRYPRSQVAWSCGSVPGGGGRLDWPASVRGTPPAPAGRRPGIVRRFGKPWFGRSGPGLSRSPRPRLLATLWFGGPPAGISALAVTDRAAILDHRLPGRDGRNATLCPGAIGSVVVTLQPARSSWRPASSGSRAVATLSRSLITRAAFTGSPRLPGIRRRATT